MVLRYKERSVVNRELTAQSRAKRTGYHLSSAHQQPHWPPVLGRVSQEIHTVSALVGAQAVLVNASFDR